jgi:hypothetical protein
VVSDGTARHSTRNAVIIGVGLESILIICPNSHAQPASSTPKKSCFSAKLLLQMKNYFDYCLKIVKKYFRKSVVSSSVMPL